MGKAQLRLVCSNGIAQAHRNAAAEALKSFEKFGVKVETPQSGGNGSARGLRCGRFLNSVVRTGFESKLVIENIKMGILEVFSSSNAFGVALITQRIIDENSSVALIGCGQFMRGAVVSVLRMLEIQSPLREAMIISAVRHEAGHIFIPKALNGNGETHCKTDNCVMNENDGFYDFMARHAIPQADFCSGCETEIMKRVNILNGRERVLGIF